MATFCSRRAAACIDGAVDTRCIRGCSRRRHHDPRARLGYRKRRVRRHESAGAHSAIHRIHDPHLPHIHRIRPPRLPDTPWLAYLRRAVSAGSRMRAAFRRRGTNAELSKPRWAPRACIRALWLTTSTTARECQGHHVPHEEGPARHDARSSGIDKRLAPRAAACVDKQTGWAYLSIALVAHGCHPLPLLQRWVPAHTLDNALCGR